MLFSEVIKYKEVVINNGEVQEVEKEEKIYFMHTLKSIKMYELNFERNFFDDYTKASMILLDMVKDYNVSDLEKMSLNEQINLLPLVSNKEVMAFLMDYLPCAYAEINNDELVQNELTFESARLSNWIMELVNVQFFAKFIAFLNKGTETKKTSKVTKKK